MNTEQAENILHALLFVVYRFFFFQISKCMREHSYYSDLNLEAATGDSNAGTVGSFSVKRILF